MTGELTYGTYQWRGVEKRPQQAAVTLDQRKIAARPGVGHRLAACRQAIPQRATFQQEHARGRLEAGDDIEKHELRTAEPTRVTDKERA